MQRKAADAMASDQNYINDMTVGCDLIGIQSEKTVSTLRWSASLVPLIADGRNHKKTKGRCNPATSCNVSLQKEKLSNVLLLVPYLS